MNFGLGRIEVNGFAAAKLLCDIRHGNEGGKSQLTGHDRGVGKESALLHDERLRLSNDDAPTWVRMFGDQDIKCRIRPGLESGHH